MCISHLSPWNLDSGRSTSIEKRGKKESQHRFIFYYVFIPLDYFVTCSYYLSGHSKKRRVDSLGTLGLMNPN